MKLFTIGFTQKSAREFFTKLRRPGLVRVVDVRLNNVSQLAGFSKRDDLQFFCESILSLPYVHLPELAPEQAMLDEYRKKHGGWPKYEKNFLELLAQRKVEDTVAREVIDGACLLCSEPTPENCHRRLVAEYLQEKWGAACRSNIFSESHRVGLRFVPRAACHDLFKFLSPGFLVPCAGSIRRCRVVLSLPS